MNWVGKSAVPVTLFLFFIFVATKGNEGQMGSTEQVDRAKRTTISEMFRSVFSGYWERLKTMTNQVQASIFPPNLDFRGSHIETEENRERAGAGEKMKEAVAVSLEKSKEAVEHSARSAATFAGETVQKTKEKVKKTLSGRATDPHQSEL
ncbi:hypothetical protein K2173_018045 [Erythroxylum novogranatense]|uniref:Uncharacterized protein n=1 Tax=Erythroxylum novogranatense TaxID=1862640 RepID=A0AAV8TWY1_9ROSI|nr:hypothetical protein K2173_018045 [Erythroxylum novogranatense]